VRRERDEHAELEVVSPGVYASVQDAGRRGYRRVGVPWAGVLDPRLMRIANALVGNRAGAPVIECLDGGLQLAARGAALRLAVAGHAVVEHEAAGQRRVLAAWRSLTLADGDQLRVRRLEQGASPSSRSRAWRCRACWAAPRPTRAPRSAVSMAARSRPACGCRRCRRARSAS
jgi:hypothetical protein